MSTHMKGVQVLKVPLDDVKLATNNFGDRNFIARGGFGNVYIGKLTVSGKETTVAVKRLDHRGGQGNHEFLVEIQMLSCYKHQNLVTLVGFSEESGEKILIYEHVKHGSLDRHISSTDLLWIQRLKISIGAARGFNHLHNDVGPQHRVLHRDIKSSNILLDENWEAKISDFGLSKIGPSNIEFTFLVTNACGTFGYVDPQYIKSGILTKESDVYSFGVVLFELLCGRLALIDSFQDERRFLSSFAKRASEEHRLYDIILPAIKEQMKVDSLNMFSTVAYNCLKENRSERPTMGWVAEKLEKALQLQVDSKVAGLIRVGIWGKQSGDPEKNWSFELNHGHKLQKITINHGNGVYSLMFTAECRGVLHTSHNVGGLTKGKKVSQVRFDFTTRTRGGDMIITSLTFVTNKRMHGPFGKASNSVFSVPFEEGSFGGLYGIAGHYIDGIGVYVKPNKEITRVGTWGTSHPGGPQNIWYCKLERSHLLNKITIEHGDLIYSLIFTTIYNGSKHTSKKFGGWKGGDKV